jgi:hypothetical protein
MGLLSAMSGHIPPFLFERTHDEQRELLPLFFNYDFALGSTDKVAESCVRSAGSK